MAMTHKEIRDNIARFTATRRAWGQLEAEKDALLEGISRHHRKTLRRDEGYALGLELYFVSRRDDLPEYVMASWVATTLRLPASRVGAHITGQYQVVHKQRHGYKVADILARIDRKYQDALRPHLDYAEKLPRYIYPVELAKELDLPAYCVAHYIKRIYRVELTEHGYYRGADIIKQRDALDDDDDGVHGERST